MLEWVVLGKSSLDRDQFSVLVVCVQLLNFVSFRCASAHPLLEVRIPVANSHLAHNAMFGNNTQRRCEKSDKNLRSRRIIAY